MRCSLPVTGHFGSAVFRDVGTPKAVSSSLFPFAAREVVEMRGTTTQLSTAVMTGASKSSC